MPAFDLDQVGSVMQQRNTRHLHVMANGVGARLRHRLLAPALLYLLLSTLVLITACAGRLYWPQLAPLVLLFCVVLVGWVRAVRRRWLGAYLLAIALLLLLQTGWSGLEPVGVQWAALAAMALGLAQVLIQTARLVRLARVVQLQADGLGDAEILALLPPDAAVAARQWLSGDDRHAAELSEVVSLSVLHACLQQPGMLRRWRREVLPG